MSALPGRVAVIGAGNKGRVFAFRCTAAGFDVVLEDVMPARLRQAQQLFPQQAIDASGAGSLRYALTVEDAVRDADLAVDFVPDELESKLEIFSLLDRMAPPHTVLCTPTRNLSLTDLASCTYRPSLCIGLGAGADALFSEEAVPAEEAVWFARANHVLQVEVIASRFAAPAALAAVASMVRSLAAEPHVTPDCEEPMLVKNETGAALYQDNRSKG